jgi:CHAT domain-containing protein/tetratricopeptide (TPR) repeat protein
MTRRTFAVVLFVAAATAAHGQQPEPYQALYQQGRKELAAGRPDAALKTLEAAAKLAAEKFGPGHPNTALVVYEIGEVHLKKEDYPKAEAAYLAAKAVREKWFTRDHPSTANAYDRLGEVYLYTYQFAKAEPLLLAALDARLKTLGPKHDLVGRSYKNLGAFYREAGNYTKAEAFYRKAVALREAADGPNSVAAAVALNDLGRLQTHAGNYRDAEATLRKCLAVAEANGGAKNPTIHVPLGNLGDALAGQERYADAEQFYLRALRAAEAATGSQSLDTANLLDSLAQVYVRTGRLKQAVELTSRALTVYQQKLGKDAPLTLQTLARLGRVLTEAGEHGPAEVALTSAVRLAEKMRGKDHPDVADRLNDLGLLYTTLHLYDKAEPLHARALAVREKALGKNHPITAVSLINLGDVHGHREEYDKAEACYTRARVILDAGGRKSLRLAVLLNNLYQVKFYQTRQVRIDLLTEALDILERQLGAGHPSAAQVRTNLGFAYYRLRQLDNAEPPLREALAVLRTVYGDAHPDVIDAAQMLAAVQYGLSRRDDAVRTTDGVRRQTRHYVTGVLPGLSDADQVAFLKARDAESMARSLTIALDNRDRPDVLQLTAAWLMNGKATVQEVRALSVRAAAAGDSPAAKELREARAELARLTLAGGADPAAAARRKALADREKQLVLLLGAGGRFDRPMPWVEVDDLRRRLPEKSVFVDIARFGPVRLAPRTVGEPNYGAARYVAWVTPKDGPVRLIDLGPTDEIDDMVRAVRTEMADAPKAVVRLGEPAAEKQLRTKLDALSARVLHPLLKKIGTADRWVVSPDGGLWLLPWTALTLPDDRYAVEAHKIRTVVSGRDLVAAGPPGVTPTAPVVVADPDFDLDAAEALKEARRLLRGLFRGSPDTRALRRELGLGKAPRLPGTATEAEAIAPRLEAWLGVKPRVFTDRQALKSVVLAARNPAALVLSTHGYFKEDQRARVREEAGPTRAALRAADGRPFADPLTRCGLLFAACNSPGPAGGDDGVLTGLDVLGCDLRGTRLVVLSACETGLGDVRNGEGVAGLRQAFHLAGAESVVATLWQVPDRDSALLMAGFFGQLGGGKARDAALRAAQLEQVKRRRDRFGAAHPYFWAAYTLTGRGD